MEDALVSKFSAITHFELPLLPNNIPFACHPAYATLSHKIDDWFLRKMSITSRSAKTKVAESKLGLYTCMMYPNARSDKLFLAGKHLMSAFGLDDFLECGASDEMDQLKSTVLTVAGGTHGYQEFVECKSPQQGKQAALHLYAQVMEELRASMESLLLERYVQCLGTYLDAIKDQVCHRSERSVPGKEEYRIGRRATGFIDILGGIMTEFCTGIRLSQADVRSPVFRELIDRVADYVCLVNDLLSFRKELYEGDYHHNWISVLLQASSSKTTTFQDAVDQLCQMIQEEELAILKLQKEIASREPGDSELLKFALEFPYVASGTLVWTFYSGRYHGYGNPLLTGKIFSGTWLLHPVATVVLPMRARSPLPMFPATPSLTCEKPAGVE